MRHTLLAVILTPIISGFVVALLSVLTSFSGVLSYSRSGPLQSIADFAISISLVSLWIFVPMTLLLFLPIHLVLLRINKRGPGIYAASFLIAGLAVAAYLFRFLPAKELVFQVMSSVIVVVIPAAVFWAVAVLWPLLQVSSNKPPQVDAPPSGRAPPG